MKKSVLIIGGGISGLTAAHHFQTQARDTVDFRILESSTRVGGKILTVHENGFIVEGGPDSFLPRKTGVLDLCGALGLQNDLIEANQAGIFVWSDGRLIAMPDGLMMMAPAKIGPFLKSSLISWPGKIRMGLEALIPARRDTSDESLGSFVRRRLGQEALDKIAGPLFAGIHSGNPETLSLRSTFPMFSDMERKHGSLLRAMLTKKKATGAPPQGNTFFSLRGGLQTMVDALEKQLPADKILRGWNARRLVRTRRGFEARTASGQTVEADAVLLATPAHVTADIVEELDAPLAQKLKEIRYASTATVSLGFRQSDIPQTLNGTGFVVSQREKRRITACTWSSVKFPQRAPEGLVLLRAFMGGARTPGLAALPEEDLIRTALDEFRITLKIEAQPVLAKAFRWPQATPQYEVGHAARVAEIEELTALMPGLHLTGAAYRGGGIPDCVQNAKNEAKKIVRELATPDTDGAMIFARMEAE
jgi:oxygen-dependent protoporphyrinogen oxidase